MTEDDHKKPMPPKFIIFAVGLQISAMLLGLLSIFIPNPFTIFVFMTAGVTFAMLGLGLYFKLVFDTLKKTGAF